VLDTRHDCLFILTVRNSANEWYGSLCRHFDRFGPSIVDYHTYGYFNPHGRKQFYRHFYQNHVKRVKQYFKLKENLVVFNVAKEESWRELCAVLDVDFDPALIEAKNVDRRTPLENEIQASAANSGLS